MKIERFEDINAWKEARDLTRTIYSFTAEGRFNSDFGLRGQIQRAAISIMSNIAEGFEVSSDRDFARYLCYAKGSASEVQSHLYGALDLEYIRKLQFDESYLLCDKIKNLLGGFIGYLKADRSISDKKKDSSD